MRKSFLALALAALIAGCASTPPPPPTLDLPAATAGDLQLDRWWTAFSDPTLDQLVVEALANNLDLKAAITRVEYGRALVLLAQSDQYPTVDGTVGASRTRSTQVGSNPLPFGFSPLATDLSVGLQASYEVDLWAKYRNATAAAQDDLLATEYAREVVRTLVAADTARGYFNLLAADAELAAPHRHAQAARRDRRAAKGPLPGRRHRRVRPPHGGGRARECRRRRGARAPDPERIRVRACRVARTLAARKSSRRRSRATSRSRALTAVPTLPSGVPSDMLARRPDIRRAEAQLAAGNIRIDVARADYYPSISLTGSYGTQAGALSNLFTGPGVVWGLAASLLQPLIGLKKIEANVDAQTARRDELVILYTQTVQGAFRDAHDALSANDTTREALAAQNERRIKLQQALELSTLRYTSGYSPYLEVLDAQRQLLQAQTLEIIAARNVRLSLVDFAKAAGGGWEYKTAVAQP